MNYYRITLKVEPILYESWKKHNLDCGNLKNDHQGRNAGIVSINSRVFMDAITNKMEARNENLK
jgi:hypothetical protein